MVIHLGAQSPTLSSSLPAASLTRWAPLAAYLALLPLGFTLPRPLPARAVSSYLTFSPLPDPKIVGGVFSVALSVAPTEVGNAQALPGSAPIEPGLSSNIVLANDGRDHPVGDYGEI